MSYTPLLDTILTGDPRATTPSFGDNDTSIATTAYVHGNFVNLTGSQSISGAKTFSTDVTFAASTDLLLSDSSTIAWSDVVISRTAADVISLASGDYLRVQTTPTNANDVTNKSYVDSVASGLDWKASVRAATAAALPAYTRTANVITADANGALAAVDGVTLVLNDRLLLKDGAAGADNGLYYVSAVGDGSNPFTLTRTTDADSSAEVTAGLAVFVEEGTANADKGFVLTTNNTITLNTTSLAFTQFTSTGISTLDSLTDVDTSGVIDGALLRYESSGTQWNDTSTLLYTDAGLLRITTTGSGGGIEIGGDTQIYRSAADTLFTPDDFHVLNLYADGGNVTIGTSTILTEAVGSKLELANSTLRLLADDSKTTIELPTGTNVGFTIGSDTNLYRSAANTLKTDDALTVLGKLTHEAGLNVKTVSKTANYTVDLAVDYVVFCDSTSGGFTITLPSTHAEGDMVVVKDSGGVAATNNIVIDPNDSDTIDGLSTFSLNVNYQSVLLCSNGTNWFLV